MHKTGDQYRGLVQLLVDNAVTIAKSGDTINLHMDSCDIADEIFDSITSGADDTQGEPVGWEIVGIGADGSVLCRSPLGKRKRWQFGGGK